MANVSKQDIKIKHKNHIPVEIILWKVKPGDQVQKDENIGQYDYISEEYEIQKQLAYPIRASTNGKIESLLPLNTIVESCDEPLGVIIEPCAHSVQVLGLCALCGKDIHTAYLRLNRLSSEKQRASVTISHKTGVTVSHQLAQDIEKQKAARLLKARKLSLLLDLDQTLVHATVDPSVQVWLDTLKEAPIDIHSFTLPGIPNRHYIKLRPGTADFLEEMNKIYEMHIYTHGSRNYAEAVAKAIDPTKKYFGSRILSRDDSGSARFKSLRRLFPYDESMVIAVDDRGDVWNWSPNLLKVKPYSYFVGTGDINEPGNATTEADGTLKAFKPAQKEDDRYLEHTIKALKTVHRQFFQQKELNEIPNVCQILPAIKHEVLSNVNLCFSGVIPTNIPPELHDFWILATQFGASCQTTVTLDTTHLIASRLGTDKVNLSIELNKIWIIKLEWLAKFTRLLDSIECFNRLHEKDYLLDNDVRPSILAEKKTITNWDDADEELNQFLNEDDSNEDEDTTEETRSESSKPTNSIKTEDHIEQTKDADSNTSSDDDWLNAEISTAVQNISGGPTLKRKYSPSL